MQSPELRKRLPRQTLDTLEQILNPQTIEIVLKLGTVLADHDEVAAWLHTPNQNFDGVAPIELIISGRAEKVMAFITSSIAQNFPAPKQ